MKCLRYCFVHFSSLLYTRHFAVFWGWVCGLALALFRLGNFMGADVLNWLRLAFFPTMPEPPALAGTETLVTVLMAMLGLGGLRTVEKLKGVSRDKWGGK